MTRARTKGKSGRKSEMTPAQTEFLESYGERFQSASGHSAFYSEVVSKWIENFGYMGLNPNAKPRITIEELRLDVEVEMLELDERTKLVGLRESARQALRVKLGNWFRHRYNRRRADQGVDDVMMSLLNISAIRPRRKSALALYSELYYNSKLKEGFDAMWSECRLAGVPVTSRIKFIRKYTMEHWAKVSEELKQEIEQKCESQHAEALQAWKGQVEWTASAEAYQSALANLDAVLPPFADAISKFTGMVTIVTIVGPSGDEGGDMVVRSTQSVTSKDNNRQAWAQADPAGYRVFQDSLLKYGSNYYSEAECLARVVHGEEDAMAEVDVAVGEVMRSVQVALAPSAATNRLSTTPFRVTTTLPLATSEPTAIIETSALTASIPTPAASINLSTGHEDAISNIIPLATDDPFVSTSTSLIPPRSSIMDSLPYNQVLPFASRVGDIGSSVSTPAAPPSSATGPTVTASTALQDRCTLAGRLGPVALGPVPSSATYGRTTLPAPRVSDGGLAVNTSTASPNHSTSSGNPDPIALNCVSQAAANLEVASGKGNKSGDAAASPASAPNPIPAEIRTVGSTTVGRKRKGMGESTDPKSSNLPSRRVRKLPPHLEEIGYTAPKKGKRAKR